MVKIITGTAGRRILGVVVGLALLGGAFYGGRVYQNNADQKLFAAYNPPQATTGRGAAFGGGASGFGGGGTQNSQVAAALTVGTPPAASSGASSVSSAGGGQGGSGAAAAGQGAAGASSSARPIAGQLVSLSGGTLSVQSFQGQQSLPTTAQTRFYQVAAASTGTLAVGQKVTVAPDPTDASAAASVTIAPSSTLFVRVRAIPGGGTGGGNGNAGGGFGTGGGSSGSGSGFGTGGGGGFGAGGGSGSGGAGATGGGSGSGTGGFGGGGFRRAAGTTGTITSLGDGTLTLKTTPGTSKTVKVTATTRVYRVVGATVGQFKAGSYVSIRQASVNGKPAAAVVVGSTISGAIATLVAS